MFVYVCNIIFLCLGIYTSINKNLKGIIYCFVLLLVFIENWANKKCLSNLIFCFNNILDSKVQLFAS